MAEPDNLRGGAFFPPDPRCYHGTPIKSFTAPDPLYQGFDALGDVIPEARKRGMKVYPYAGRPPGEPDRSGRRRDETGHHGTGRARAGHRLRGRGPGGGRQSERPRQDIRHRPGAMLFDPIEFIVAMSRYITLSPGDVMWMGTDGTADVVPGQVVSITIDGLGTLTNPVIPEVPA